MNESIKKLKSDVGPLTDLPVKQARGIVNRLASGQEVQRLCALAVKSLHTLLSNTPKPLAKGSYFLIFLLFHLLKKG
ncbi:hypothetical protein Hanom_Chr12g01172361 [Helianthus anomalus]